MRKRAMLAVMAAVLGLSVVACDDDPSNDPRSGSTVPEQTGPAVATTAVPPP